MSSYLFFFYKQKTAYELRISDWSSDVCSSDLPRDMSVGEQRDVGEAGRIPDEPVVEREVILHLLERRLARQPLAGDHAALKLAQRVLAHHRQPKIGRAHV